MELSGEIKAELTAARLLGEQHAREWGLALGEPFELALMSFVAPAGASLVLKVSSYGDDESLHEGDALERWGADIAVRVLRREGRVLLEQRAVPGTDLSSLDARDATAIAVQLAVRLWQPASAPYRPVDPEIPRWLDRAEEQGGTLVDLARQLHEEIAGRSHWLVHGDFHHHNILKDGLRYLVIDPKPYLTDREYDVATFLWNPRGNHLDDRRATEATIAAFVEAGLDEFLIRAWTVIRGAYLRPQLEGALRALVS